MNAFVSGGFKIVLKQRLPHNGMDLILLEEGIRKHRNTRGK
jgi:hypothetical protein